MDYVTWVQNSYFYYKNKINNIKNTVFKTPSGLSSANSIMHKLYD